MIRALINSMSNRKRGFSRKHTVMDRGRVCVVLATLLICARAYKVPVRTSLSPASTTVSAGSQLSLPCDVEGYPEPEVHWTKDDVLVQSSDRIWITGSRLTVPRAEVSDSGVYKCQAANAYTSHSSSVRITVQEVTIPATCIDNPTFANCALIVQSRFCVHKYYSKFCCKSCVEAGQLDPREALMQGDQPLWRRK